MKIAVIGAGPSGLCAAKNSIQAGHDVIIFEQTSTIGGQWVYTDNVEVEANGHLLHTSMYKSLTTNVPIESMGYIDFPFPKSSKSFVHRDEVLRFFQSYANTFDANRVIKFDRYVIRVHFIGNRWEILSEDLKTNAFAREYFDAVFVCNGHYTKPFYPEIDGMNTFTGRRFHSHNYRQPEQVKDETVLIIGGGPSGKDIALEAATSAKKIVFSTHRDITKMTLAANVIPKADVKKINGLNVEFDDGSVEEISMILFCTGYVFSFPFLTVDSGIYVRDNFIVEPLYKHLININHPTLAVIGLQICAYTLMYDLQARLCLKYWSGDLQLPTKDEMLRQCEVEMEARRQKDTPFRQSHLLGESQNDYMRELIDIGKLPSIPEVLYKIYDDCTETRIAHPNDYRSFNYNIVDDNTFTREYIGSNENLMESKKTLE